MPNTNSQLGYHGTSSPASESILRERRFIPSAGLDKWLGEGIYFFLASEAFPDAQQTAKNWAISAAYDKQTRKNSYTQFAVLEVALKLDRLFDLGSDEHIRIFNKTREAALSRFAKHPIYAEQIKNKFTNQRGQLILDHFLLEILRELNLFDAFCIRGYVKQGIQLSERIDSRVPNAVIISVVEPESVIDTASIRSVESGDIPAPQKP
jgi:hypothetical protein